MCLASIIRELNLFPSETSHSMLPHPPPHPKVRTSQLLRSSQPPPPFLVSPIWWGKRQIGGWGTGGGVLLGDRTGNR
jgi:hypothetical protein